MILAGFHWLYQYIFFLCINEVCEKKTLLRKCFHFSFLIYKKDTIISSYIFHQPFEKLFLKNKTILKRSNCKITFHGHDILVRNNQIPQVSFHVSCFFFQSVLMTHLTNQPELSHAALVHVRLCLAAAEVPVGIWLWARYCWLPTPLPVGLCSVIMTMCTYPLP